MICVILVALVFMVRFVLNTSKIYVNQEMTIHPFQINWGLERDGSLRVNDPFYVDSEALLIITASDNITSDSALYRSLVIDSKTGGSLKDLKYPYMIWKNENSDTIHVLKNNIHLSFQLVQE